MSVEVCESIAIDAPIEQVWDLVMDPRRLGEWVTAHRSVEDPPAGPLDAGSRFEQHLKLKGMPFTVCWTVVESEPPRRARWEGTGPARSTARVTYELEESGEGTRFDYRNAFDAPGGALGRMAARVVSAASARGEAQASLRRLKDLLERSRAERDAA